MNKRTIVLYGHLLAPIDADAGVGKKQWRAIWHIQEVAMSLARMFNGRAFSNDCGTVQYDDHVEFEHINDVQMQFILDAHPYAREINKRYI